MTAEAGPFPRPLLAAEAGTCQDSALFWQRTAAFLIDLGLLGALHIAYFFVLAIILFKASSLDLRMLLGITITYGLLFLVCLFFLAVSYFTILHAWGGQTVGKIIISIRVIGTDDRPLSVGKAFLRTSGYFVSALPLGAGFLWVVLDREGRSWHDLLAGSKVVFAGTAGSKDPAGEDL